MCVTCHVAVDQLRSDWSAAVHVDVEMSRRVAVVFVRLAGLFVHSWERREITRSAPNTNHVDIGDEGDEERALQRILGTASYVCISTESTSHNRE